MTTAKTASAQTAKAAEVADAAPTIDAEPAPHVIEALRRVMRDLPAIGKNQSASAAQGGYAYRGIEQITPHTQVLFAKHGVVFVPRVVSWEIRDLVVNGKPWMDVIEEVEFDVYGPGGIEDKIVVGPLLAIGRDNSDKGGTKCLTQAYKYALLQALSISDAKDDADGQTHEADARPEHAGTAAGGVKQWLVKRLGSKEAAAECWAWGSADEWLSSTESELEALAVRWEARDGVMGVGGPDGAGGPLSATGPGVAADLSYSAEALKQAEVDVSEMDLLDVEEVLAGWEGVEVTGNEVRDRARLAALFAARASASG